MAQFILIVFVLFSTEGRADLFGFGSSSGEKESKIPALVEKLNGLDMKNDLAYEDSFNQVVKSIENAVEEEKLFCAGESTDGAGKTVPVSQKQLCMRELKKNYVKATGTIFELKKKYLEQVHKRQLESLSRIEKKLKEDIEKNF